MKIMHDKQRYIDFAKESLGIEFDNQELFITALTHRSYLNEHRNTVKEHNERLEFLGDAVLELIVTEYLFKTYSEPEGVLTNWRSSLVRTESISAAATKLGYEPYLRLSRGEKRGTDRARAQILANSFEAVLGAIYLDKGYDAAKAVVDKHILSTFEQILETGSWLDPKSRFQELAQSELGHTPIYKVIGESGPDHDKIFTVGVYVEAELYGEGSGPSKQSAQQAAAEKALTKLNSAK